MKPILVIGFTGTRSGMTDAQKATIKHALTLWSTPITVKIIGLHGDCVGADEDFHNICRELGLEVWKMPSTWDSTVAGTDAKQVAEPRRPYARNRHIAEESSRMLACPPNFEFIEHSGTWYTLNYAAKKLMKRVTIVFPDGTTEIRNKETS